MSEPKLISPMLDNFLMGDPFSDHQGVRCCPAMKKDTEEKYIVKIISIPASQIQLDALLLTGAYPDKEAALAYFKELSDGVVEETKILEKLAQLEGFIPYESCQVVEMEDRTGYDVYLLSPYKRTLEHIYRKSAMTHLGALNLGLDMCAALAVCRRTGYLYADLKPDNIFISGDKEYRIGDLGFLSLDSLKYASLPEKYRSDYTPPEISDAFSSLNTTMDIFAAGLILYQAYNNGALPVLDKLSEGEPLPAPAYADYEIAEIILKACAPAPEDRWQDPIQMGQALVSYMQRNGANDTPITPVIEDVQETPEPLTETVEEQTGAFLEEDSAKDDTADSETDEAEVASESDQFAETASEEEIIITEESIFTEDDNGNLTFLDDTAGDLAEDETIPGSDPEDLDYEEVSEEVNQMLNQADELIAHDAPDPVVAPEPIEIPIPEPIPLETEEADDSETDQPDQSSAEDAENAEQAEESKEEPSDYDQTDEEVFEAPVRRPSGWLRNLIIILLLGAIALGGWLFYRNYYLQPVSLQLLDSNGVLTVLVDSQIDEKKLTVVCSDTYGNQHISPVEDGKAVFEELVPNSAYTVQVTIQGFHQLVGKTSAGYTTPTQTNIVQLSAVTGPEDGSVIIGFTIDGPDSQQWTIQYVSDDGEVKEVVFAGHMVTINGLTVGNSYDFTLIPNDDIQITGTTQLTHTASKLICAADLTVSSFENGELRIDWTAPADTDVSSWSVRCYNNNGYDTTSVTSDLYAVFTEINSADSYTIEVTAAGMSVCQRTLVTENSITVSNLGLANADAGSLCLAWESSASVDSKGWVLFYSVNGGEVLNISGFTENTVTIPSVVPEGKYAFTLQTVSGNTVINGSFDCTAPEAVDFEGFGITANDMDFYMCRTPDESPWDEDDLRRSDYVTSFSVGEKASFLIRPDQIPDRSDETVTVMFILKDSEGQTLSNITAQYSWDTLWSKGYATLDLPWLPDTAGSYDIGVYFNGMLAFDLDFTIV